MDPSAAEAPSPWIRRWAHLIAPGSRVLDVACGAGRHTRWLAHCGLAVTAVDRDAGLIEALRGIPGVTPEVRDLEAGSWPYSPSSFGAIVVTRYLYRPHLAALIASLEADGVLVYETFAAGNERFGRPSNPDFLLQESELIERVRGCLRIVAFEQGIVAGERPAVVQRLCAVGAAMRWPVALAA